MYTLKHVYDYAYPSLRTFSSSHTKSETHLEHQSATATEMKKHKEQKP